ncbi:TIGR00153 family protein [Simkania negevensis]|uniref:TIGR00153 family protein n=1 Tax=Simkania negevensis TaxID=83561 RepID=A0ABS3APG3_9BACT|nr:TIGR00153 family protein [Simkania negevensis]
MQKVESCVKVLPSLFAALEKGDSDELERLAKRISKLEHDADIAKNSIRNNLRKGLFLPVDRGTLLEILSLQDTLADKAEDIAVLLTLKKFENFELLKEGLAEFLSLNLAVFDVVNKIVQEFDELLSSSFGGSEAEKVLKMIEEVAYREHEIDLLQHKMLKNLYIIGDSMLHTTFQLWLRVLSELAALSNLSEKLANRIRMTLDHK